MSHQANRLPVAVLDLHTVCNQRCPYCVAGQELTNNFGAIVDPDKRQKVIEFFAGNGPFNIVLTGGEPLITPGLPELLTSFVGYGHTISMQSNLRVGWRKYHEAVPAENNGWILASFHSVELDRFDRFLKTAQEIKAAGYSLVVKLILDEKIAPIFHTLFDTLSDLGIGTILAPLVYFPEGKDPHPSAYSTDIWQKIIPRMTLRSSWLYFAGGFRGEGTICNAGMDGFYMRAINGQISGCAHSFPPNLGSMFENKLIKLEKPVYCQSPYCICDFNYYIGIIKGIDDTEKFEEVASGLNKAVPFAEYQNWIDAAGITPLIDLKPEVDAAARAAISYSQTPAMATPSASGPFIELPGRSKVRIPTVSVEMLPERLGFSKTIPLPKASYGVPYSKWKMEVNDAPILAYLLANSNPKRHLEFGTWQGFGTLLTLQVTNATVWTLNLPGGEIRDNGDSAFAHDKEDLIDLDEWAERMYLRRVSAGYYRTDTIGFIGRHYLKQNLGHRVNQIYCDSKKWDTSAYPRDFFDTVFIDGGHQTDIVSSDTRKAFEVTRPGGLIIWHDFCPEMFGVWEAVTGVTNAIGNDWQYLQERCKDIFWITPSFMLAAVVK